MKLLLNKLVPQMGNNHSHYRRGEEKEEVVSQYVRIISLAWNEIEQEVHRDDNETIYGGMEHHPGQKEINPNDDKIQAGIVAGVKAPEINGH